VTLVIASLAPLSGAGPSFKPDVRFTGNSLTAFRTLGDAGWRAQNGEITGVPKTPGGGWLVFDKPLQDVGFFGTFQCTGGCKTGVLLRAETMADGGMKGVFVSLADTPGVFAVTLDAQGRETAREPLRSAGGGQIRIAPPPDPNAAAAGGRGNRGGGAPPAGGRAGAPGGGAGRGRGGPAVTLPIAQPNTGLRPNEWNDAEILLDANIVRAFINNQGPSGAADDPAGRFGPIALYVGGTGEVKFKDIAYKDLAVKIRPVEQVSSRFRMQRLSDFYYSFGAAAGDYNRDNVTDVVAGPHIYFGPDFTKSREIYLSTTINPSTQFASDCWMQYSFDFTGDGWDDVINASFGGANSGVVLYVNPKGEPRRWDSYRVVDSQQTEIAVLSDIDGDKKPEFVYGAQGTMRFAKPDPANPTGPWTVRIVSEPGYATAHGVGAGDVNGDGRTDILNAYGWWEQPSAGPGGAQPWTYHPEAFGRNIGRAGAGGSVMAVYDVNGDKLNDVVTSLAAHGWGLAWYEQKRDASGTISFVQHMVMDDHNTKNAGNVSFSQVHGTNFADVDGDGITDFIAGKRYWSHQDTQIDPDPYGDAVLYWYRTVRNSKAPGGAELVPELVHNRSGAGSDVYVGDINKDGRVDLLTSTKFGTFLFFGQAPRR
jgi:hypothetical protein